MLLMALTSGTPAILVSLIFLWSGNYTPKVQWTLTVFLVSIWLGYAFAMRSRLVRPLQTIANLLAALREGDFSIRARGARHDDALGDVLIEVNSLSQVLREQRLSALEATALLSRVMAEIEVAVFAFDGEKKVRLANRAAERLLAQPVERLLGREANELGLGDCLTGEETRTIQADFPNGNGKWEVRRSAFREGGAPLQLLVLSNLSRALREEERLAWQRLVRVLSHELNNSLTPIKSIAGSLESLVAKTQPPDDWREDMKRGLNVIATRAAALSRFMESYARLARLPQPKYRSVNINALIQRLVELEKRLTIHGVTNAEVIIQADGDQLEQLLINLLRNAVDAALETAGKVEIHWQKVGGFLEIVVHDEGPGIVNPGNLFVPFFTTKPGGSGIGLVLSRQIAEAHGGSLTLENRRDRQGCEARLRIPL
ncbi:MAG: PAS domain-containing sensor histidine kinase [Acidobacteria bacterium]|nr:PAS domain-containing sensor histidine kinase [Acidobacteriota bacterium]